jgi:hypothetical protein
MLFGTSVEKPYPQPPVERELLGYAVPRFVGASASSEGAFSRLSIGSVEHVTTV